MRLMTGRPGVTKAEIIARRTRTMATSELEKQVATVGARFGDNGRLVGDWEVDPNAHATRCRPDRCLMYGSQLLVGKKSAAI